MIKVRQTRHDHPFAAKPGQQFGWVLIRTDVTFGDGPIVQFKGIETFKRAPFIGVMSEPYDTAEHALAVLRCCDHVATVAYAEIERA